MNYGVRSAASGSFAKGRIVVVSREDGSGAIKSQKNSRSGSSLSPRGWLFRVLGGETKPLHRN